MRGLSQIHQAANLPRDKNRIVRRPEELLSIEDQRFGGLSEMAKHVYSTKDPKNLQSVIDNDLEPTLMVAETAEEEMFSKRRKTAPGRTKKIKPQGKS